MAEPRSDAVAAGVRRLRPGTGRDLFSINRFSNSGQNPFYRGGDTNPRLVSSLIMLITQGAGSARLIPLLYSGGHSVNPQQSASFESNHVIPEGSVYFISHDRPMGYTMSYRVVRNVFIA
jgi:hypothetical protein